jgi:uncharacterized membrane protein YgcG
VKRVVVTVVLAVALGVAVLWPALGITLGSQGTAAEDTSITQYDAQFDVSANGDLAVTERLTVDFPGVGKHGIFRFFDTRDPSAPRALRTPHDISVMRDGRPEPFELSRQKYGRYVVARIGDPNVTVGLSQHTYVIRYRIDGVLEPGADDAETQFYWNLIPGGWQQRIGRVHLVVHLPASATYSECIVGDGPPQYTCAVTHPRSDTLTIDGQGIAPRTPLTLKTGLPIATPPAGQELSWPAKWVPVLGDSTSGLVTVVLLALLTGGLGALLTARTIERKPRYPVQYAPPPDVGPAEAAYLVTENVDQQSFVASLLWAAQQGAVELSRDGDSWTITDKAGPEGWAKLDRATVAVAPLVGGAGGSFRASKDVETGRILQKRIAAFERETKDWALGNGYMSKTGFSGLTVVLVLVAAVLAGLAALHTWFGMSVSALVPGFFAIAASGTLASSARTWRTAKGRELWSRLGGFRRMLSTPSSKERFDFSGRQDLYTAYIPWAVAFGCADEWAKKYRTETGTEPPVPAYFGGYYAGSHTGDYVNSMVHDFSSTVSSSISAYQATQSHSSGGGGGFSGGGGGGGGGGGSW